MPPPVTAQRNLACSPRDDAKPVLRRVVVAMDRLVSVVSSNNRQLLETLVGGLGRTASGKSPDQLAERYRRGNLHVGPPGHFSRRIATTSYPRDRRCSRPVHLSTLD